MTISSTAFSELLTQLDDLSSRQTYAVVLHLREVAAGDVDPIKEAVASLNSLTEIELIKFFTVAKSQFNKEDWKTLMDLV